MGEFPLNNLVLGGKRLYKNSDFYAVLVRPDIVPFVAESSRDVKRSELRELYFKLDPQAYGRELTEKEFDRVWSLFRQIQQLFDDASADRAAVLFTAARGPPLSELSCVPRYGTGRGYDLQRCSTNQTG